MPPFPPEARRGRRETEDQLNGRLACDLYYVENWSLAFDLLILGRTLFTVLSQQNAVCAHVRRNDD
jgi:lipopolysaccharide/colanic/teichoic acid biosynthesis glycosyltransferase